MKLVWISRFLEVFFRIKKAKLVLQTLPNRVYLFEPFVFLYMFFHMKQVDGWMDMKYHVEEQLPMIVFRFIIFLIFLILSFFFF